MKSQSLPNPFDNPMTIQYRETPRYTVECACGTTVKGSDEFFCPHCKRIFSLNVMYINDSLKSYHSYRDLYEVFLVSPSENGLGYSQGALEDMLSVVTEDTELIPRPVDPPKKLRKEYFVIKFLVIFLLLVVLPALLQVFG